MCLWTSLCCEGGKHFFIIRETLYERGLGASGHAKSQCNIVRNFT